VNTDERRAKKIVAERASILANLDKLWQDFLNSDYRKGLGNQKPHALAQAFSQWLLKKDSIV
jgi:hypothetical protein